MTIKMARISNLLNNLPSSIKLYSFVFLSILFVSFNAYAIETKAKQAILIDYDSGDILLNKNSDERMYPASMTKMMTAYMIFDRIKNGSLSLDDTLPVSEEAWRKGGSKMFVEVGKKIRVEDLIRGIIIQSGNDATIVAAEGLSGSEDAFAIEMTAKAHELGMVNTQFKNASGWPDPEHYTTAHDLAILAVATIRNFPEYYHIYSEESFTYNGITQSNRNPLLYLDIGSDGLKTGHTEDSGYGLTASAVSGDRRLIMVLNGMESKSDRKTEGVSVMTWGLREWNRYPLFKAGQTVADSKVWLGQAPTVPLIIADKFELTMRRKDRSGLKVTLRHSEPVPAPIVAGAQLGSLLIEAPEMDAIEIPLLAAADVPGLGTFGRLNAAIEYLLWGEN